MRPSCHDCVKCAIGIAHFTQRWQCDGCNNGTGHRPARRPRSTERSTMTVLPQGSGISRRRLLQFGAAAGFLLGAGGAAGCAGPTGLPGPSTLTLALNRSLVSLDNKLNQFDAAVTVQRAVRQGLTAIGPETKPVLVLADRFEMTSPTQWTVRLREGVRYSDGTPLRIEDIATALKMYQQVQGSFVAGFFPEFPTVVPVDDRTFRME